MLLGFAYFYTYFIPNFSKIAISLISILKTSRLFGRSTLISIRININKVIGSNLEFFLFKPKKNKFD